MATQSGRSWLKIESGRLYLALALALLVAGTGRAGAQEIPRLTVLYQEPDGSIFDRNCPRFTKAEVKLEWIRETVKRRGEFQAAWDGDGREFLLQTLKEIGAPFPYREMQIFLTVCPGVDSMSDPMFLDVRRFLSDANQPTPVSGSALLMFHELMHHYVRPILSSSPLMKKYSVESANAQNHLHVLALEKFVLMKTGRDDQLKRMDAAYRTGFFAQNRPAYKRAWEIVNDIEGHEVFIQELKATLPKSGAR